MALSDHSRKNFALLHLDDDHIVHYLCKRMIENITPDVRYYSFTSVHDALTAVDSQVNFDALLVDLDLPVLSGWDFLDRLRDRNYGKPVFILTSSDNPRDRSKMDEYSFVNNYFLKPLTPENIFAITGK